MSKVRVYELAKRYGMKGPELAKLLRESGFEKIKSHMAVLDDADEMLVVARLEAMGRKAVDDGGAAPASGKPTLKKKTLGGGGGEAPAKPTLTKKPLGEPAAKPKLGAKPTLKKKTLGAAAAEAESAASAAPAVEAEQVPEAAPKTPAASAPAEAETPPADAPRAAETTAPETASSGQPTAGAGTGEQDVGAGEAPAPASPEQAPAAEQPAQATPEKASEEGSDAAPKPSLRDPEAPAGTGAAPAAPPSEAAPSREAIPAAGPDAGAAPSTPPPAAAPETGAPTPASAEQTSAPAAAAQTGGSATDQGPGGTPTGAAAEGGEQTAPDPKQVKKLVVPQAKAQVLRRIELPEATIRDATRRSAPPSERSRSLARKALQNAQSRSAPVGRVSAGRGRGRGGARGPGRPGEGRQGRRPKSDGIIQSTTVDPNKVVEIEPPTSVKALSEALGIKVNQLIATLAFKLGIAGKTINSFLTDEEVELVALELNRKIKLVESKEAEEELFAAVAAAAEDEEITARAPVVTFMGHVDHGKTSLLDALRDVDVRVTKGEAGGITQKIGAYKIARDDGAAFVVLDTPGHAAFTQMRARGANLTDIVVLVVAADDGVMPQTEEALSHAKAAGVPIVVAVNKCDKDGANPMQVRQQLALKELQPEEWGGTTAFIDVSAITGQGLDELIDRISLEAEAGEVAENLKARPSAAGAGTVVESRQSPEQGVVVTVLVTDGTLRVRDQVVCGESFARVRTLIDDRGVQIKEAGPSTPVTLLGLDTLPMPGDKLIVVEDSRKAREVVEERTRKARAHSLAERSAVTLETLSDALSKKDVEELKVILKADVMGSLEPIKTSLADLATDEVRINVIHAGLGGISETDVSLAAASGAVIVGFNAVADTSARHMADQEGVEIRYYDVIYSLVDDMKLALEGLLAPEEVETVIGTAEVRALFRSSKFGTIAGCFVTDGVIQRNAKVKLIRDGRVAWTGKPAGLRRVKDDVKEVKAGYECGVTLERFNDIKEGDVLEFSTVELVKRTLA